MKLLPSHIDTFRQIVGAENVCADSLHLYAYSFDSTRLVQQPDCVIFPQNQEQISQILIYCNQHHIPVTPRGAGSGMSGGAINDGVILALQKHLNRILEIDTQNLTVTLQPGVINAHLNEALGQYGLFFPPDPASQNFSTIGGNLAQNAGGMNAVKYGVSKDYVLSLQVVIGNGDILTIGHNTLKDVAGYNLTQLFCGSAGTLGIITQATLKLKPILPHSRSILIGFSSFHTLSQTSTQILASAITPEAMEFLDSLIIQALNTQYHIYPQNAQAILIIKLSATFQEELELQTHQIQTIFKTQHPLFVQIASTPAEEEQIWFGRKNASQATNLYGVKKLNEDITIPKNQVANFLQEVYKIGECYGFKIPCFGHIGDGNIHTNIMLANQTDLEKGKQAVQEVFALALKLGGTLSGEHGIGLTKSAFMPLAFSQTHLEIFKQIKKIFDPNSILNPNKMLP
ncbi:glycolate oxidase subunit GlcD [Helicobacter enhydrae]|uniref:Glycolate oxidase subunit GlcD n=1 Tax=Helicobacter enhydrae TaxID=222136 RepID=A0A1B1U730_9HELI|nr:FAD-linked oxidase C-terminal domain-containing protein [Helicobacter enhydrae]ANV98607.1 glycolate oxidase subunit GlcD [Helicobacter enhydrae]